MANKSKQKGTSWETAIVNFLHENTFTSAKRKVLSGSEDKGDIEIETVPFLVIEAKNKGRYDFSGWLDEADKEAEHSKVPVGVVWAHRTRKANPADGYVVMSGASFVKILHMLRAYDTQNQVKCSILDT